MAAHQTRAQVFITSYACKTGQHGAACTAWLDTLAEVAGEHGIICHCPCHPPCQRPACVATRAKGITAVQDPALAG